MYAAASSSSSDEDDILATNLFRSPPTQQVRQRNSRSAQPSIARQRIQLGSFLNRTETEIRSTDHATSLIGLIELGRGHPDGIAGAFGHNNRISWFRANTNALFREDGPLGRYVTVSAGVLVRHVGRAQVLARSFYDRDHSNEQSGAAHEDVPEWARLFFQLFQAQENQVTTNALAAASRDERRSVVASLVGRQAPLGFRGNGHAQLRTETARNNDVPRMRQQIIGDVNSESVRDNADDDVLVEGRDDVGHRRAAPRRRMLNGVHHRNIHLGFRPESNNPSSRFHEIQRGYASLDSLTHAVVQSFASPQQGPSRQMIDVAREYQEASQMLACATEENDKTFYTTVLRGLNAELVMMTSQSDTSLNEENDTSINE